MLRIYRINATDSVRQVMRMVFSPAILPALHRSSFELGGPDDPGYAAVAGEPESVRRRRRLLYRAFEEQATRVCVGVRALVERALAENMSIVVEGIHLTPSLIPFADLEGAAFQVVVLLATLDEETHRARFLARGPVGVRRSERYLESFRDIRAIQERLLALAEHHDVPILVTGDRETSMAQALRLITSLLRQQVPRLGEAPGAGAAAPAPTLLLVVDGLADRPVRALAGRTPLQAAHKPTLDRLAREGRSGLADPVAPGVVPDTASGSLAVFGQSPRAIKRGPVEAIGAGLAPGPGTSPCAATSPPSTTTAGSSTAGPAASARAPPPSPPPSTTCRCPAARWTACGCGCGPAPSIASPSCSKGRSCPRTSSAATPAMARPRARRSPPARSTPKTPPPPTPRG